MLNRKNLGQLGEKLAKNFLIKNHYRILQLNFRSKFGEIDIVAQEGGDLVFVEVKTRWGQSFGLPAEAITPAKIKKIIKAGQYFRELHSHLPEAMRLDAVVIDLTGGKPTIELIKNITG